MKKFLKYLPSIVLSVALLSLCSFGQSVVGSISGTVKDQKGGVIPGASVTVTGANVGFSRTVQSDSDGVYRIAAVPAGTYKVTVAPTAGFAAATLDNVTVLVEKNTTADITAGISANVNTVEVSADPLGVNVDTTDSKVQTNITRQLIEKLPTGANFDSLLKISPATRPEPKSGGFQVDGASGSENTFLVDGQPLENFRTGTLNRTNNIPTSLVSEVQIKTGGFEAEHGGASGGVITVITKSGSDAWHGNFGYSFEPSKFQPAPRVTPSVLANAGTPSQPQRVYMIGQPKDRYLNTYPEATFSGPILKKHLWFIGSYSPQIFDTRRTSTFYNAITNSNFSTGPLVLTPRVNGTGSANYDGPSGTLVKPTEFRLKDTYQYAFARVDASIFSNLRAFVTYLWNPQVTEGNLPFAAVTTTAPTHTILAGQDLSAQQYASMRGGRENANTFSSSATWTPTAKLILNFRYGRSFLNQKNGNYAIPQVTRFTCTGDSSAYAYSNNLTQCPGGPGYNYPTSNSYTARDVSLKNEFNADATYLLNGPFGHHQFKGGYQFGKIKNDVSNGYATLGIIQLYYGYTDANAGFSAGVQCDLQTPTHQSGNCLGVGSMTRFGTNGVASNKYQAIYFQDKWQPISRLTLNLGVRAESENLPAFNTGNTGGQKFVPQPIKFGWGDKIAPRLGGSFDVFGDGKTKIWASYGWFFDRLKFEAPRGSFGGDFYRVDYFPISTAHPEYSYYTLARIKGNFADPIGGGNPSTAGGLSVLQRDFRIPSNLLPEAYSELDLPVAGVDPDLKAFRQDEFTVGFERELSRAYVISARFTRKNVAHAIEDHALIGPFESENYPVGNPGEGRDLELDKAFGYIKSAKPQRLYRGLEISLNKRFSNNYFFNVNYTLSKLSGNYSGLASSDENGRTSPGVNRFFDYALNGYTALGEPDNGDLATDRRHAFKAYGGYTFNWWGSKSNETNFSFFQQVLQGTPITTFISIVATSVPLSKRGDLGRTPSYWQTDFGFSHKYKFGRDDRFAVAFDINALNVFNNNAITNLNSTPYRFSNSISGLRVDPCYNQDNVRFDPITGANNNPDCPLTTPLNTLLTPAINAVLAGKIGPILQDLAKTEKNALYGAATSYQSARSIRFGFRFMF